MENKYIVSSSPHLHTSATTSRIMLDVIIALIPTTIVGWLFFGLHSVLVTVTAMAAAVAAERIFDLIMKKPNTCRDLSALLTGLLIGLNMPPSIPIWMVVIGSAYTNGRIG